MMAASLFAWTDTSLVAIAVVILGIPVFYIWKWAVALRERKS